MNAPAVLADPSLLAEGERATLLRLAELTIRSGLERRPIEGLQVPASPRLRALAATFVTLERDDALLGCIGTIEPVRPLYEDVMGNAYRSAFADPRLPPVGWDDYDAMDVKISVLSALEPCPASSRRALIELLRPGIDGVLLSDGRRRATFLPAVWRKVEGPDDFVDLLLDKGGWRRGRWPHGVAAWRYGTVEFASSGPRLATARAQA